MKFPKIKIIDDDPSAEAMKEIISPGKDDDTYSYKGWLISDSFVKRALAVIGYNAAGSLFFYGTAILIILAITSLASLLGIT